MKPMYTVIFIATFLVGCATTQGYEAILNSWVGDSTDHLVSVWGIPQKQYNQDSGGKVLEYERSGQIVIPGTTSYKPVATTYTNGSVDLYGQNGSSATGSYDGTSTTYAKETSAPTVIQQACVTRFTADASGRITNWAWQGNACLAVPPKKPSTPVAVAAPAPATPAYQKCTADQLRRGECS